MTPTVLLLLACAPGVQTVNLSEARYTGEGAAVDEPVADTGEPTEQTPDDGSEPQGIDRDGDGWTRRAGDCDDDDPEVHPAAPELCDGLDNDCDAAVDEDLPYARYYETDYGADGSIDYALVYEYDENGRLLGYDTDTDNDGLAEQSRWYVYDAFGRLESIETDIDGDGLVDEVRSYIYDEDGQLVRIETDTGPDGVLDRIDTYVWDNGVYVQYRSDTDADGDADLVYSYDWTPFGRVDRLLIQWFDAETGEVTNANQYDYVYDENDFTDWVIIDLGADGIADTQTNYDYNRLGQLHRYRSDTGADGVFDSQTMYKYDDLGRTHVIEIDSGIDGVDTRTTITYACLP